MGYIPEVDYRTASMQEVFDYVCKHLLKQNIQSLGRNGMCAYRGESNLMCAAGCLISDKEYQIKMEGNAWRGLIKRYNMGIERDTEMSNLIVELQRLHDQEGVHGWLQCMYHIANKFGLSANNLPALEQE
jgi:hypothetical protein